MSSPFERLLHACSTPDPSSLQSILSSPPSPALTSSQIQTLFHTSASHNQPSTLHHLLTTFPTTLPDENTIRTAIYTGSAPLLRVLLARDPSLINTPFDRRGTPLSLALSARLPVSYIAFLLDAGADPNGDTDGLPSPLAHAAALYETPDAVVALLARGARVGGSGAIGAAAHAGRVETERVLRVRDVEKERGGR